LLNNATFPEDSTRSLFKAETKFYKEIIKCNLFPKMHVWGYNGTEICFRIAWHKYRKASTRRTTSIFRADDGDNTFIGNVWEVLLECAV